MGEVNFIFLWELIKVIFVEDLKSIIVGRNGEYIFYKFYGVENVEKLMIQVKEIFSEIGDWDIVFFGSFFFNQKMLDELVVILFIFFLLMYFILVVQFESFMQFLLVLMEILIDVVFVLVLFWVCGYILNLMLVIGLIVICGIVINDFILKLDVINELCKEGVLLLEVIYEVG